jgi:hypothetical protein
MGKKKASAKTFSKADQRALVVGVSKYPNLADHLPGVAADVRGMAKVLSSKDGSFASTGVTVLMTDLQAATRATSDENKYLKSSFYEQLVEHVFVSEVLQEAWFRFGEIVEVLRAEVDASGYDIVLECNNVLRHIQLKTSKVDGKTANQKVNVALASKPSGCVVWILRSEDQQSHRMRLTYRFFGNDAGEPLPSLDGFRVGKHTKGNKDGVKAERPSIRVVPKRSFEPIGTTNELVTKLFGLRNETPEARKNA